MLIATHKNVSVYLFMMMMCPNEPLFLINLTLSRIQTHAAITFTSNTVLKSSVLPSEKMCNRLIKRMKKIG